MPRSVSGSVAVEDRKTGKVWIAAYVNADGQRTRKVLGPAWVRDGGERTPRGAVQWRPGHGSKPASDYLTPKEAQHALDALLAAERARATTERRPVDRTRTFGDAVALYFDHCEHESGLASSTLRTYRSTVQVTILPAFPAELPLKRVTIDRVERFRQQLLRSGKSRKTCRDAMLLLRGILKRAERKGWLPFNPVERVDSVHVAKRSGAIVVLTRDQVEAIARACALNWAPVAPGQLPAGKGLSDRVAAFNAERERQAQQHANMIRLAAYSGLRRGELIGLRQRDVDLTNRWIHVYLSKPSGGDLKVPKSGKVRSVPMLTDAMDALARQMDLRYDQTEEAPMFQTATGAMVDGPKLTKAFNAAVIAAGLGYLKSGTPPLTFHSLRHVFGTTACRKLSPIAVQGYMGHADIATTMIYVHHQPDAGDAALIDEAFRDTRRPASESAPVDLVG